MTNDIVANRHVVLSGCSGGGKSTLLAELARRGFRTVPEPGRRIVAEETRGDGRALPWVNPEAFARRAIQMACDDRLFLDKQTGWIFFDRGLVDAAVALQHVTGEPSQPILAQNARYHQRVFMTPPWLEIYATDTERRHAFKEAVAEYDRLLAAYSSLGYETIILPKVGVDHRADFILGHLH